MSLVLVFLIFSRILKLTGKIDRLINFDYNDYKNMSFKEQLEISLKYAKITDYPNYLYGIYRLISIFFDINIILDILFSFLFILCVFY